jgi:hypothetical protein
MADDRSTQTVSLGRGTLILIALIVLIFGRGDTDRVESELRAVRSDVAQLGTEIKDLKEAVEQQTEMLKAVARAVEQLNAAGGGE